MKSKLSWIFAVPFTLAAVFFKLAQTLLPDGSIFGLSDMMLDYVVIGCVVIIFLFTLIMCLIDRRISQYYLPHRNIPAGILGLLLAIVCAADGANKLYQTFSSGKIEWLEIVEAALLLLSSIVFIVMGLTHSFVNRDSKHFALFNVMPALLCAIRLVRCFISFTTVSITLADVSLLACYIFATLFFFNFAVAISLTEAKHAVKSCFIFGFPAMAALLAYGVAYAYNSFNLYDIFSNAGMVEMLLMALYIFAFLLEMTIFVKDRDHVKIEGVDDGEYEELSDEDTEQDENFVVTGMDDENRFEPSDGYLNSPDFEDYIYRATEKPEEQDNSATQSDPEGYITEMTDPHEGKTQFIGQDGEITDQGGYDERLDAIDKLILEITDSYDD